MTETERDLERWLLERPKSCAVADLRREYRERFLTPEAVAMIEAFRFDRKPLARVRRRLVKKETA